MAPRIAATDGHENVVWRSRGVAARRKAARSIRFPLSLQFECAELAHALERIND